MHLYTRKNGNNYYAQFYFKDEKGINKLKSINTGVPKNGSKKEAKKIAEKKKNEFLEAIGNEKIAKLTHTSHSDDLFSDYIKYWLKQMRGSVRDNTLESYEDTCNAHIIPLLGDIRLKDIDQFVLADFIEKELKICKERESKIQKNPSKKIRTSERPFWFSIDKHISQIKMILEFAYNDGDISSNPAKRINKQIIKKIPKSNFKPQPYTPDEIALLKSVIKGETIEIPIIIASYTGLRRSEILGLKWSDIDFAQRIIYVRNTCVIVENKSVYRDNATKTDDSYAVIPLADTLADYLSSLKKQQDVDKAFFGEGYYDSDYVCRWSDGHLIKPNYVSQTFKNVLTKNGLRGTRFHDLRHTVGTTILEATGDIQLTAQVLRHSNINTTSKIYVQPSITYKRKGIDAL